MKNADVKIGLRIVVDCPGCKGTGEVIGVAWNAPLVTGWIVLLDQPLPSGDRGVCLTPDLMEPEASYRGSGFSV